MRLTNDTIAKIAAGEVIERPAYIVKELIENAIDAHATHIQISIEQEGLRKIVVSDNGIGMDREDIQLCFERHTTSKIEDGQNFFAIQSMGFRGEALASIAAIGNLTIRSRPREATVGTEVVIHGSEVQKLSAKGMPTGTQVIVESVFERVPVRKKFLQSSQFEYRLILDIVTRFTTAFPHIAFDFTHDGKRILTLPAVDTLLKRSTQIIPPDVLEQLLSFHHTDDYITVEGYISPPQLNYKTSRNMQFYVNNRFVREPSFTSLIKEVYGTLLEPVAFPYVLLFISLPHHLVDVNVHPRKEAVHFMEESHIGSVVQKAIDETLITHNLRFYDRALLQKNGGTKSHAADVLRKKIFPQKKQRQQIQVDEIVQVHNLYLIIPTTDGILMIDQHAAHERILFEQFQKAFLEEKAETTAVALKKPVNLSITLSEIELIKEKQQEIESLGFSLTINNNELSVIKVPALFKDRDVKAFMRDILDDLYQNGKIRAFDTFSTMMLEYLACRNAIKAGDTITKQQAKELIEDLNKTNNPYTCPHGRPTQVAIELSYVHTLFKRQ